MVTDTDTEVALIVKIRKHPRIAANLISAALLAAFVSPAFAQTVLAQAPATARSNSEAAKAAQEAEEQAQDRARGVQSIGVGRRTTSERSLRIIPGFSTSFTASNNVDLEPRQTRQAGNIFQITPFVEVRVRRPGSTANFSASARGQKFTDSDFVDDRVDGELSGNGDISINGDAFRLRGDGRLFRIDETGLGGTGVTGGARTQSTTTFRSLRVNPYSLGRLTQKSRYEAGYEYELIDRGIRSDSNRLYGELDGDGFGGGQLGLLASVDLRQTSYENDFEYDNFSGLLGLSWALSGRLKIGAGVFYQGIDAVTIDGENSGIGPAIYWDWRASERSALQGQIADTYYGENISVRFRQLFSRWVFSTNYQKSIEDGNRASTLLFRPINGFAGATRRSSDRTLNEFNARLSERDLGLDAGSELFVTTLNSALVYDNTLSMSAAYIRPRNAGLFSLFYSDREAADVPFSINSDSEVNQWGGYGVFDFLLSGRNSIRLIGQYRKSDLPTTGRSALFTGVDLSWKYRFNPRASIRFAVRHSIQDGDGGALSYGETAGTISYLYRYQ